MTNNTNEHINEMLKTIVLPQIVAYYNKQYELNSTVDELEQELLLNQTDFAAVSGKKRKKHVPNKEGKKCQWEFKRGDTKNTFCPKIAIEGSDYCATCSKRKVVVQNQNNVKNVPKGLSIDNLPKSSESDYRVIDVYDFDPKRGLYQNKIHNLVFHRGENNKLTVVGATDQINNKMMKKLTEEDIIRCKELGYPTDENYTY